MKKYIPALVLALLLCCRPLAAKEQNVNIYDTVREAPQESFYASDGRKLTLADFKGKFILLVSWSRDCLPCIRELPSLKGFYDATQSSGIELILLSDEGEWSDLEEQRRFLKNIRRKGCRFMSTPGENWQKTWEFLHLRTPYSSTPKDTKSEESEVRPIGTLRQ